MKIYIVKSICFLENQVYDRLTETMVFKDEEQARKRFDMWATGLIDWYAEGDMKWYSQKVNENLFLVWVPLNDFVSAVTLEEFEV